MKRTGMERRAQRQHPRHWTADPAMPDSLPIRRYASDVAA
jgi:hypothetical protein